MPQKYSLCHFIVISNGVLCNTWTGKNCFKWIITSKESFKWVFISKKGLKWILSFKKLFEYLISITKFKVKILSSVVSPSF